MSRAAMKPGVVKRTLSAIFGTPRQRTSSLTTQPHVRKEREPVDVQRLQQLREEARRKGNR